jgi:hypothetical protein
MVKALNVICYLAFATALITLPFLLINWVMYLRAQPTNRLVAVRAGFPIKSVAIFVLSILTVIVTATIVTTALRNEALSFLESTSGNYRVQVDGREPANPDRMISALKQLAPREAHHSHPTKRILVEIQSDHGALTLELGRDSDNPQEYWVFSTKDSVTSSNEIGRITTAEFDGY